MTAQAWRTVVFGIVLAILVVPLGGPNALLGLLIVAGLVAFDLWRQQKRRER